MNKYESVIIINPTVEAEKIKTLVQKFTDLINNAGKVEKVDEVGKKKLAYEVKKNKEGIYIEINFTSEASFIVELERQYKIDENVIKFIVIRKED